MSIPTIWTRHPETYAQIEDESRKRSLYPELLNLVQEFSPRTIIDYGCGDGSFLKLLDERKTISAYDSNSSARALARKNLKGKQVRIYNHKNRIPSQRYDCVVLSLVLMTIRTRATIRELLKNIKRIKRTKGKALIAITHPCFRECFFSTFYSEYAKSKKFNYFADGTPFRVRLMDRVNRKEISFHDYHWSLSTTLNLITESGLKVFRTVEVRDTAPSSLTYNKNYPPYLIIICD